MTQQDRDEFRLFCKQATDAQVLAIYHKEVDAAQWDAGREIYVEIALGEYLRRELHKPGGEK